LTMQIINKFNRLVRTHIEYIALLLSIVVSFVIYQLKYYSYLFLSLSVVFGVLLFIISNRYFVNQELSLNIKLPHNKNSIRYLLSILFFIFYGLSFLALLDGFYTKTFWYYLFISLCTGIIATEILFVETKNQGTINLIKTFLLILNVVLSNQIIFPYGIGSPDSNYHIFKIITPLINSGYIPPGFTYSDFPCHHILTAITSLVVNFAPRMIYYCLYGFLMCLGVLFVFLIGRMFFNLKFGLFAALMYSCCCEIIYCGLHASQVSYSCILLIMIFSITLYIYRRRDPRFTLFFVILATTMVFAHHHSAMVILIILSSMAFVEISEHSKERDYNFRFTGLAKLFMVIMFAQWMYYSGMFSNFIHFIDAYYTAFTEEAAKSISIRTRFDELPLKTLFLNELGESILMFLSVIGALHFFKHPSFFKNIITAITIVLLLLIGTEIALKESALEPRRLYTFMQPLALVFFASGAMIWMLNNLKGYITPVVVTMIVLLSFFSLSNTITGFETSLFVEDMAYWKLYETPFERHADNWIGSYLSNNSTVNRSWSFRCPLSNVSYGLLPIKEISNQNKKEYFIDTEENV